MILGLPLPSLSHLLLRLLLLLIFVQMFLCIFLKVLEFLKIIIVLLILVLWDSLKIPHFYGTGGLEVEHYTSIFHILLFFQCYLDMSGVVSYVSDIEEQVRAAIRMFDMIWLW